MRRLGLTWQAWLAWSAAALVATGVLVMDDLDGWPSVVTALFALSADCVFRTFL